MSIVCTKNWRAAVEKLQAPKKSVTCAIEQRQHIKSISL